MQADFELAPFATVMPPETKTSGAQAPSTDLMRTHGTLELVPVLKSTKTQSWESFEYLYQYSSFLPELWEMLGSSLNVKKRYVLIEKTNDFNDLFTNIAKQESFSSTDLEALQKALDVVAAKIKTAEEQKPEKVPDTPLYIFGRPPGRSQIKAFYMLLSKEKEAMQYEDHELSFRLDWSSLEEIDTQLKILETQIREKNYWHLWQCALHSDCAELCKGISLVIKNFANWFKENQNKQSHKACRRAIQDLDYLMDLLNSDFNLLKKLQTDLPQLPEVMDLYRSKRSYALMELRIKYEKSYDVYGRRVEDIKKLGYKMPEKANAQQAIRLGVQASLSNENSTRNALTQIRALSNAKYNEDLNSVNAAESQSYYKIWQLSNKALTLPKEKLEETKQEQAPGSNLVVLTTRSQYIPKKAIKNIFDWDALTAIIETITPIINLLNRQAFYFLFVYERACEKERLSLLNVLNQFAQYFIIGNPNYWNDCRISEPEKEMRLKKAQDHLDKVITKLQAIPELLAVQSNLECRSYSELDLLIYKTLSLYHDKLNLNLNTLYKEYLDLQKHLNIVQKEYLALEADYAVSGIAWKKDQLQDLVKITCDQQVLQKSPLQIFLEEIQECLKAMLLLEPKTLMSISILLAIKDKIIEALMPSQTPSLSYSI